LVAFSVITFNYLGGGFVERAEHDRIKAMSDADLLDYVTETQGSQRGHLARHILASRQHDTMKRATIWAAVAAGASAVGAIVQAVMTILS
jgi:hypothetical protein